MWNFMCILIFFVLILTEKRMEKQYPEIYRVVDPKVRVIATILILLFMGIWGIGLYEMWRSYLEPLDKSLGILMVILCEMFLVHSLYKEWRVPVMVLKKEEKQ